MRAWLRARGYGDVIVKKRGINVVPEELRAALRLARGRPDRDPGAHAHRCRPAGPAGGARARQGQVPSRRKPAPSATRNPPNSPGHPAEPAGSGWPAAGAPIPAPSAAAAGCARAARDGHPLAGQAHGELGPLAAGEVDQARAIEPGARHELHGEVVAVPGARVDDQRVLPRGDRTDHELRRPAREAAGRGRIPPGWAIAEASATGAGVAVGSAEASSGVLDHSRDVGVQRVVDIDQVDRDAGQRLAGLPVEDPAHRDRTRGEGEVHIACAPARRRGRNCVSPACPGAAYHAFSRPAAAASA